MVGRAVITPNNASITKAYDGFRFTVPKSKVYKPIYEDRDIREILQNRRDGFEMISGNMVGKVSDSDISTLVKILQSKYNFAINISKSMFETLVEADEIEKETKSKKDSFTDEAERDLQHDKEEYGHRMAQKAASQAAPKPSAKANALKLKLRLLKLKLELMNI